MKTLSIISYVLFCLLIVACQTEEDPGPTDTEGPTIISISPEAGDRNVSILEPIVVVFSEPVNATTVTSSSLSLRDGATTVSGSFNVAESTVTFSPASDLSYETSYSVTVGSSITDEAGNRLTGSRTIGFTTIDAPDTTAPIVASVSPESDATDVAINSDIEVTFSESIDLGSVTDQSVYLTTTAYSDDIQAEVSVSGRVMTIDPTQDLREGVLYTVVLGTGLTDLAGNSLATAYESSFTTFQDPKPYVESSVPATGAANVSVNSSFEITFSEEMNVSTVGFRFNFPGGFSESATVSKNNRKITIKPQNPLMNATEYRLVIYSSSEDLSGNTMESNYAIEFTTEAATVQLPTDFQGNWYNTNGTWIYGITEEYIRTGNVFYYYTDADVSLDVDMYYVEGTSPAGATKSFWFKLTDTGNRILASKQSATSLNTFGKVVGRTVTGVIGTLGHEFVEVSSGNWEEYTPSGNTNTFTEEGRDDWSVFLIKSDGARIQIDCFTEKIKIKAASGSSYNDLYDIESMTN